jgi:hypothetical protein
MRDNRSSAQFIAAWLACGVVLASGATIAQTVDESESLDAPDELVSEGELALQQKARSRRQNANTDVDFVTVTRNSTRTGNGSISLQVQPFTPQREIRLRASDARQLAEGANSRLQLQRDRLSTQGAPIRSVTLEFTVDTDEVDGLPALIPFNATTSLFNFDYVRLENSRQPLIATLKNAMDPETWRCTGDLTLGIGDEAFHDRFVLLGNKVGDCDRTVRSREGGLLFSDTVAQRLRQELRSLYDSVDKQFARDLGSETGVVFVIWRPHSQRSDFRLVRSLNTTSLLVFNGPSWEQGFTVQQRDELGEAVAQERALRIQREKSR